VEHRPNTLNDYVGGQSFCCGEKEFEPSQTGKDEFETSDYEQLIFFYHPDHLGSTALVTDNDGNVVQSVAYIPYGEVFIEERNGTWNTPYLFNAKELDEEAGLYYYGARYLNPTSGMWLSTDPLFEKNIDASPYSYCHGNPVNKVDVMGLDDSFYCEDGSKIGSVKSETNNYYVVRTTQTTDEMYAESTKDHKGNSNPISQLDALRARMIVNSVCIGDGVYSKEEIPMHLFTQIPNQEEFDAAMKFIKDDGTGGRFDYGDKGDLPNRNHREYAFNLFRNNEQGYYVDPKSASIGDAADASTSTSVSTDYRLNHTHPSGVGSEGNKWQQAPSATDISNSSSTYNRRVWGMGNKTIYIFNKDGVQATIPFSVYRR
jgi:RHS repeat-associated protein